MYSIYIYIYINYSRHPIFFTYVTLPALPVTVVNPGIYLETLYVMSFIMTTIKTLDNKKLPKKQKLIR